MRYEEKVCKCKKMALIIAAVAVVAEWMPGEEIALTVYAAEPEMSGEPAAERMEEAAGKAEGKAKSRMEAVASKSEWITASKAAAKPGGIIVSRAEVKLDGPADGIVQTGADSNAEGGAGEIMSGNADGTVEEGSGTEMTAEEKEMEQKTDAYFDDTVFVGDSIMLGFRNYAMKRQETFLSRMQFLAAGSYSANNSLWDLDNKDSVHPVYKGEPRYVWDSIAMMGSRRVFIMLGMNDLNVTGLDGSVEKYEELIGKIKESAPDAEIHIMSMTYILHGKEVGKLENNTIREYNSMLQEMAKEKGLGYVNVADALADSNGDLAAEYCSDEFAHQNPEAYDIWVSVLREYAKDQLK